MWLATDNLANGDVVPIPTLPPLRIERAIFELRPVDEEILKDLSDERYPKVQAFASIPNWIGESPSVPEPISTAPLNVEVAVVLVAAKNSATTGPTTESRAYGEEVPRPILPFW